MNKHTCFECHWWEDGLPDDWSDSFYWMDVQHTHTVSDPEWIYNNLRAYCHYEQENVPKSGTAFICHNEADYGNPMFKCDPTRKTRRHNIIKLIKYKQAEHEKWLDEEYGKDRALKAYKEKKRSWRQRFWGC